MNTLSGHWVWVINGNLERSDQMTLKRKLIVAISVLMLVLSMWACNLPAENLPTQVPTAPGIVPTSTLEPLVVVVTATSDVKPGLDLSLLNPPLVDQSVAADTTTIVGDWRGTPLTKGELTSRMAAADWYGLVDYVSEDVDGKPVSRLIFGGIKSEQQHALEVSEAVANEFDGVLWFVYGDIGSGKECGYRETQQFMNLLRIEVYSDGSNLPEITSCRQAPG